jgi:hypothetical protein
VKEVAAFVLDARAFRTDWELQGPMVPGLDPMEAVDRLKKFQQLFEARRPAAAALPAPAMQAFPGLADASGKGMPGPSETLCSAVLRDRQPEQLLAAAVAVPLALAHLREGLQQTERELALLNRLYSCARAPCT